MSENGAPPAPDVAENELSPEELAQQFELAVVDVSQYRTEMARDYADEMMASETTQSGFRGLLKKVWKGSVAREYYRVKYTKEATEAFENGEDLHSLKGEGYGSADEPLQTTVNRFISEYEEAIHAGAGEKRELLDDSNEAHGNLRQEIKRLIDEYVSSDMSEADFVEQKNQMLRTQAEGDNQMFGEGMMFADNLFDIARTIKDSAEHRDNLDEIVNNMRINVGEARMGVRSQERLSRSERLAEKLTNNKFKLGTVAAVAVAAGAGAIKFGGNKAAVVAGAATGVFGAGAAFLGYKRESGALKRERAHHQRDIAVGKETQDIDFDAMDEATWKQRRAKKAARKAHERRENIAQFQYDMVNSTDVLDVLGSYVDLETGEGHIENEEQYAQALENLVNAISVNRVTDTKNIDLISYSSPESIESERFDLDVAIAQLKVQLRSQSAEFGITEDSFDTVLEGLISAKEVEILGSQTDRDKAFDKFRRTESLKAGLRGALIGTAVGVGFQEAFALGSGLFDGDDNYMTGAIEGRPEPENYNKETLLSGALRDAPEGLGEPIEVVGDEVTSGASAERVELTSFELGNLENAGVADTPAATVHVPEGFGHEDIVNPDTGLNETIITNADGERIASIEYDANGEVTTSSVNELEELGVITESTHFEEEILNPNLEPKIVELTGDSSIVVPAEYAVEAQGPDSFDIVNSKGEVIDNLALDASGVPTEASADAFLEKGIDIPVDTEVVMGDPVERTVGIDEYLAGHETESVNRVLWYGNDTASVYDLNELRVHVGGENNTWFDQEGNAVIDITAMMPDGSFQGGESVNPFEEVFEGDLKASVSLSDGTQSEVVTFDFNYDAETGRTTAVVPNDSPIADLFGTREDGTHFVRGGNLEIMEFTGQPNGSGAEEVKILATLRGQNELESLVISEPQPTTHNTLTFNAHSTTVESHDFDFSPLAEPTEVVVAPEREVAAVVPPPIDARTGIERFNRPTPETRVYYYGYGATPEQQRARRRERSPRLNLDPGARLSTSRELSWYRNQLNSRRGLEYIATIDEAIENSEELQNLSETTRAIVTIPVAATSESERIYNTLSIYAQQEGDAVSDTTILLHVNWIDDAMNDAEKAANIAKTKEEIERARTDFPDLNIAIIESEWERSFVEERGGVIGEVARKMYDTAMMSVEKAIREGRIESDREVLLIRNDADAEGMSRNYIENMVNAMEEGYENDVFTGAVRWGTKDHDDFPGFGVVSNFREVMHAVAGRKGNDFHQPTVGINTGVRMSTFAAVGGTGYDPYIGAGSDDLEIGGRVASARSAKVNRGQRGYGATNGEDSRLAAVLNFKYRSPTESDNAGTEPVRYVRGAQVDSASDRLLNIYRHGGDIKDAWGDFDKGGHKARTSDSGGGIEREDPKNDIDPVADRVEQNITSMVNQWFKNPAHVRTGLAFMFPQSGPDGSRVAGQKIYDLKWANGECEFTLTQAGRQWLQDRLTRVQGNRYATQADGSLKPDSDGTVTTGGRWDYFGSRARRRLYHEFNPSRKSRPNTSKPRMVKAK